MIPQHTGSTPTDLTTWGAADFETQQNLAAIHPDLAIPGIDIWAPTQQHDTTPDLAA
ncbi:hypothetical protein ACFV2X_38495 [Streptomyces sp. NPDC059679]|uniref:hypothetical protein n=1 Tax=Streptomyces sp. NPDC059679 TaxID=3346903 RepID=UPI0036BF7AD7